MALAKHRKIGSEMAARQLSCFTLRGVLQATATLEFRQSYTTNVVQLQSRCVSVAARSKQVPPSASSEDAMPPAVRHSSSSFAYDYLEGRCGIGRSGVRRCRR